MILIYMNSYYQNGRVINVTEKETERPMMWQNLDKHDVKSNFQYETMIGIYEPTQLNKLYFSRENLEIIQNMIRYGVWIQSDKKYKIDRQSDVELQIVMRSVFLEHSPNLNEKIKEQILYLDKKVADWCIPKIISEIQQYVGYINDIEKLPMPIDRPLNLSSKGTKISKSITSTF